MDRRTFLGRLGGTVALTAAGVAADFPNLAGAGLRGAGSGEAMNRDPGHFEPLEKSEDAWKRLLSDQEFAVLRRAATERAGSSPLDREKREGTYVCAGCFLPLFESATKYDSGTGWPSFWQPIDGHVDTKLDFKLIWPRTEYHCARCGGHQGHVFGDGPKPTGQRYCNNGVALRFVLGGEPLPELRT